MYRKALLSLLLCVGFFILTTHTTFAASLNNISDTITTSRPSAAAPLATDQAAAAGAVPITDNNAMYLQGDSAIIWADTGETTNTGILVASMSAANTPTTGQRTIYLSNTIANLHHKGDPFVVPITAMHTISFQPVTTIPASGKIIISFPTLAASDTNAASPSAQAFQFNGLSTSNIKANNASCTFVVSGTSAGQTPTITCTVGAQITSGTTVTILIGCSANSGVSCTTQVPTLINPMRKTGDTQAGQGAAMTTADNWKVTVSTQDNTGAALDSSSAVVGTIESVQVQATVDPTLTFQITGINDATAINSTLVTGCPSTSPDTTDSGYSPTATFVNLGTVGTGINISAQKITVSTNGQGGYSLTATSSGKLTNSQGSYNINSTTTPGALTGGTELFGIHPCGSDVSQTTWDLDTSGPYSVTSGKGYVAWPTAATALTLASHTGTANAIATAVEYAITASNVTPAGLYTSIITYVATPTFN